MNQRCRHCGTVRTTIIRACCEKGRHEDRLRGPTVEATPVEQAFGGFFYCAFCGCHINARYRACCELGRVMDSNRIEPEVLESWIVGSLGWMRDIEGKRPARPGPDLADMLRETVELFAGRVLVLGAEVKRLRELRNAVGRLSQERERSNRLAKMLSEVLEVVEKPREFLDGGLAKIRDIVLGEDAGERLQTGELQAWRAAALELIRDENLDKRRLARRVVALVDGFEEAQIALAAQAWVKTELGGGDIGREAKEPADD